MESTRGYLNFSLVLSSCYIKSICSHLNLTHRPYTINAIFVLLLFKIAISASCLLRRLYKIYMVWPSLLFKIYVPRHINFINGYIHFILFSYYSHLIYAISHILFTRPTERTGLDFTQSVYFNSVRGSLYTATASYRVLIRHNISKHQRVFLKE